MCMCVCVDVCVCVCVCVLNVCVLIRVCGCMYECVCYLVVRVHSALPVLAEVHPDHDGGRALTRVDTPPPLIPLPSQIHQLASAS